MWQKNAYVGKWIIEIVETSDGSNTLFSTKYNQAYHSIKDGAIQESLQKHILGNIVPVARYPLVSPFVAVWLVVSPCPQSFVV